MLRRLHVVKFSNTFQGSNADSNLFDRIAANELPGVLNFALRGWKRLAKRGGFTIPADMVKAKEEIALAGEPSPKFITEMFAKDPKGRITMVEFYSRYVNGRRRMGFQ